MTTENDRDLVELTVNIVRDFVANNAMPPTDVPTLINNVHGALNGIAVADGGQPQEELKPAVSIKKSVTPDFIICLEDGRKFKSLKRHLRTKYDMSPEDYRRKWGLPIDYPMVAPNYAKARSELARKIGLGQKPATPAKGKSTKAASTRGRTKAAAKKTAVRSPSKTMAAKTSKAATKRAVQSKRASAKTVASRSARGKSRKA